MSRFNYTPLQKSTAPRLITKFGAEYSFEKQHNLDYDPETGQPDQAISRYTANAVVVDFTHTEAATQSVMQGDIKLLAEAADYAVGDIVKGGDHDDYRIINIATIQGSAQKLVYYLHLRQ